MEIQYLFDFINYQKENYPLDRSVGHRVNGKTVSFSTDEIIDRANKVSHGLLKLGVKPGDKVAIISYKNRPEWCMVDIACQQLGIITVPVYPTISPAEYEYIFNDAGISYAFVGPGDLSDKVDRIKDKVSTFKGMYAFDDEGKVPHWETM